MSAADQLRWDGPTLGASVGDRAHERSQDDHVVVGRPLALHAVVADVGRGVVGEQVERCVGARRVAERDADDEQRVQLERAVVAFGGEVAGEVVGVGDEPLDDPAREALAQPGESVGGGEALPGVDPVLHAAGGHVGRVVPHRHLVEERLHEVLPGVEVIAIAGDGEGVPEVETLVQLDPLDAPLLVVGEPVVEPVGVAAEVERHAGVREPPAADVVGDRDVAVQRVDHAHHRVQRVDVDAGHARLRVKRTGELGREAVAVEVVGDRGRGVRAQATRRDRDPWRSARSRRRARAGPPTARAARSRRRSTTSGMPDTVVDTTGSPAAIASTSTLGMPSRSPSSSTRQASTNIDERRYSASSSAWVTVPRHTTRSAIPSSSASTRIGGRLRPVLAGEHELDVEVAVAQLGDGSHEDVEALLRAPAGPPTRSGPVPRAGWPRGRRRAARRSRR